MCKYFALQRPPSAWKAPGCSYRRYPVCVCLVRTLVTRTVGKEFPPLSPAFVLHSASKVLYPALALAHTHSIAYAICCNFRFRLGWPSSNGGVKWRMVILSMASSWKFTRPLVLCCIPQITDTHTLYWACIKGQKLSISWSHIYFSRPFHGYLVHFVALLINGNLCIMRSANPLFAVRSWLEVMSRQRNVKIRKWKGKTAAGFHCQWKSV